MPQELVLRGPNYAFECHGIHEAKQLGLIDSWGREGTHAPVSTVFEQGEGKLLADWVAQVPDALLVATGRYQITVYRPKSRMILMEEDDGGADSTTEPRRESAESDAHSAFEDAHVWSEPEEEHPLAMAEASTSAAPSTLRFSPQ